MWTSQLLPLVKEHGEKKASTVLQEFQASSSVKAGRWPSQMERKVFNCLVTRPSLLSNTSPATRHHRISNQLVFELLERHPWQKVRSLRRTIPWHTEKGVWLVTVHIPFLEFLKSLNTHLPAWRFVSHIESCTCLLVASFSAYHSARKSSKAWAGSRRSSGEARCAGDLETWMAKSISSSSQWSGEVHLMYPCASVNISTVVHTKKKLEIKHW